MIVAVINKGLVMKILFICILFWSVSFAAIEEEQKLLAQYDYSQFGFASAIDGDTMVIGAHADDGYGAVYVYERNAVTGVFELSTKLTASDKAYSDRLGFSVAISNGIIVAGAPYDDCDDATDACGSMYAFERVADEEWSDVTTEIRKYRAIDRQKNDKYGWSVAISGFKIIVGALDVDYNETVTNSGAVYTYDKVVDVGIEYMQTLTPSSNENSNAYFGKSVAIDGNTLIVGRSGRAQAYIFENDSGSWSEKSKLIGYNYFGRSVAISGDTVVIGRIAEACANGDTYCGEAYVYDKPIGGWPSIEYLTPLHDIPRLRASDSVTDSLFGLSVAIDGDSVVVGACEDYQPDDCSAYLFKKPSNGWHDMTETNIFVPSDYEHTDGLGMSVDISGETVVVGSYRDQCSNDDTKECGSAYVFGTKSQGYNAALIMYLLN